LSKDASSNGRIAETGDRTVAEGGRKVAVTDDQAGRQRVVEELRRAADDGTIACPRALELAGRLGVSPGLVGRLADELGLKIVACQLGCFGRRRK